MLVAMGLLAFLMLMLFRFFVNMQNAWASSMNTTELYERARVAFDILSNDLGAVVARQDDLPGQSIAINQPSESSLWFVTVGEPGPTAGSSLIEVGLRFENNRLERAFVDDSNSAWDIYAPRDAADEQTGYRQVIDGVIRGGFTCFRSTMQPYVPNQEAAMPSAITISLTLLDNRSFKLWERMNSAQKLQLEAKAARTFRKSIFFTTSTPSAPPASTPSAAP